MPTVKAPWGDTFWAPADRGEYVDAISEAQNIRDRASARGWKHMRLPEILAGNVSGGTIQLGVGKGQVLGPEQGYAWIIYALVVTGLTSGTTPDVVNLYLNDRFSGPIWWQFNGNNFGYTFSTYQRVLFPGETLSMQNSGTLAATGRILLSGELTEVPAEQIVRARGGGD